MSSVMLAADSAAIENGQPGSATRPERLAKHGDESLLRRAWGCAAGLLFLAARVPLYAGVLLFGALVSVVGSLLYVTQAIGQRLTRSAGALAVAALALVGVAGPQRARADTITDTSPLQQTTLVFSRQTNLYSFQTDGAGTLDISLKDWGFPVPLQQLTASLLSNDQVLGSWSESGGSTGQFAVQIPGAGLIDAFVAAQAGAYAGLQVGAYSMTISFLPAAPVPLPPALDLLLGGMGLLGAVTLVERLSRRRNGDVISIA
ncbi:MAG TPA: hypothetical protein VGR92_08185 [Steroidobacteraceae bacterium]|nr:hypothetical protein [Steroidobacteraceae bacterium]